MRQAAARSAGLASRRQAVERIDGARRPPTSRRCGARRPRRWGASASVGRAGPCSTRLNSRRRSLLGARHDLRPDSHRRSPDTLAGLEMASSRVERGALIALDQMDGGAIDARRGHAVLGPDRSAVAADGAVGHRPSWRLGPGDGRISFAMAGARRPGRRAPRRAETATAGLCQRRGRAGADRHGAGRFAHAARTRLRCWK